MKKPTPAPVTPPDPTPGHRRELSASNAPGPPLVRGRFRGEDRQRSAVHTRLSEQTRESDMSAYLRMAQLGDDVTVTVERVEPMNRTMDHQFILDHGLNGVRGYVAGMEIRGSLVYYKVETGTASAWVPSDSILLEGMAPATVEQPQGKSPEKMRKARDGSYNRT